MGTNYYKDCKERLKAMGVEYNKPLHHGNKSGVNGVAYRADRNDWVATITLNSKCIHLRYFKTFEDAVKARLEAEEKYGTSKINYKRADIAKRS